MSIATEVVFLIGNVLSLMSPAIVVVNAWRPGSIDAIVTPALINIHVRVFLYITVLSWSTISGTFSGHQFWMLLGAFNGAVLVLSIDYLWNKSQSFVSKLSKANTETSSLSSFLSILGVNTATLAKISVLSTLIAFLSYLTFIFLSEMADLKMIEYGARIIGLPITAFVVSATAMLISKIK